MESDLTGDQIGGSVTIAVRRGLVVACREHTVRVHGCPKGAFIALSLRCCSQARIIDYVHFSLRRYFITQQ
jgi:hypothetical protein